MKKEMEMIERGENVERIEFGNIVKKEKEMKVRRLDKKKDK